MIRMLSSAPIALRLSRGGGGGGGGVSNSFSDFGAASDFVFSSAIRSSVFEKHDPCAQGKQHPQTKMDQRSGAQFGVQLQCDKDKARDQGEHESNDDADHPSGEVGTQYIDGR